MASYRGSVSPTARCWVLLVFVASGAWAQTLTPNSPRKEFVYLGGRLAAVEAITTPPPTIQITSPTQGSSHPNSKIALSWTATDAAALNRCELQLDAGPILAYPVCNNGGPTTTTLSYVHLTDSAKKLALDFAEGAGTFTYDRSGSANNGELKNSVAWLASAQYGRALTFDGVDDYVHVPDNANLRLTTAATWMAWVKPNQLSAETVINKGENCGDPDYIVQLGGPGSTNGLSFWDGTAWRNSNNSVLTTSSWQHIAVTWNGSTVNFYVNGSPQGSVSGVNMTTSTGNVSIGRQGGTVWQCNYFSGSIDEVAIYNRTLSATEVQTRYNDTAFGGSHTLAATAFNTTFQSAATSVSFQAGP